MFFLQHLQDAAQLIFINGKDLPDLGWMQMQPCQSIFPAEPGSAEYRNASSFVSKPKPPWAWRMVRVPATREGLCGSFSARLPPLARCQRRPHMRMCARRQEWPSSRAPPSSSSGSRVVHEPGRADRMVYCSSARGALRSLQMQNVTAIRI